MKYYIRVEEDTYKGGFAVEDNVEVDATGYIEVTSQDYYDLIESVKIYSNGAIVDNPNYENLIARQNAFKRINELKSLLLATDYQAIKHSEGLISDEDYATIKATRESYRAEINTLEETLNN